MQLRMCRIRTFKLKSNKSDVDVIKTGISTVLNKQVQLCLSRNAVTCVLKHVKMWEDAVALLL